MTNKTQNIIFRIKIGLKRRVFSSSIYTWVCQQIILKTAYDLSPEEIRILKKSDHKITRLDDMFDGPRYFLSGILILRKIKKILKREKIEPRFILDFPSGYGRLTRLWKEVWDRAEITSCDIHPTAVNYCAEHFGSIALLSQENVENINFEKKYDLVFSGSLITHFNEDKIKKLLQAYQRALRPGGIVIFTTHGEEVASRYHEGEGDIGKGNLGEITEKMQAIEYRNKGFSYHDSENCGYGNTLTSPGWIRETINELPGWSEIYFEEAGWLNYQDIFAYRVS